MESSVKLLIALGILYCLLYWAVTNPASAKTIVNKVQSAATTSIDFVSEALFDKEEAGE